jgi:hypothetical protein
MSATAEGLPPLWHPGQGDLEIWCRTFEVYAASAPPNDQHFNGPHVAMPVPLTRVEEGLRWVEDRYSKELAAMPLPTLEQMRVALAARRHPPNDLSTRDSGSPCHNLWHWINGS